MSKRLRGLWSFLRDKIKIRKGFSLAEILIALAVVGVITVLLIPVITTRAQNKTFAVSYESEVKQMLNSLAGLPFNENKDRFTQTMMYVAQDNGQYSNNAGAYINKYMKVLKYCGDNPGVCFAEEYYEYKNNERELFYKSGDPKYKDVIKGACAQLKNGVSICLKPQVEGQNNEIEGWIDLNGPKKPNVYGRDLRKFSIDLAQRTYWTDDDLGTVKVVDLPVLCTESYCPCVGDACDDPCVVNPFGKECCTRDDFIASGTSDKCCSWYLDSPENANYEICFGKDCDPAKDDCNPTPVQQCSKHTITSPNDPCCTIFEENEPKIYKAECCKLTDTNDTCCKIHPETKGCCEFNITNGSLSPDSLYPDHPCCKFNSIKDKYEKCLSVDDDCIKNPNQEKCCDITSRRDKIKNADDFCCQFPKVNGMDGKAVNNKYNTSCCRLPKNNSDKCCAWKEEHTDLYANYDANYANNPIYSGTDGFDGCCHNKNHGILTKKAGILSHCCNINKPHGNDSEDEACCDYLVSNTTNGTNELKVNGKLRYCCKYDKHKNRPECCKGVNDGASDGINFNGQFSAQCCLPNSAYNYDVNPSVQCCFEATDIAGGANNVWTGKRLLTCCNYGTSSTYKGSLANNQPLWQSNCCARGRSPYPNASSFNNNCCTEANWNQNDCCNSLVEENKQGSSNKWKDSCCSLPNDYPSKKDYRDHCCNPNSDHAFKAGNSGANQNVTDCCMPNAANPSKDCCEKFKANSWRDIDNSALSNAYMLACCQNHGVCPDSCDIRSQTNNDKGQWDLPRCCRQTKTNGESNPIWQQSCCVVSDNGMSDGDFRTFCCGNAGNSSDTVVIKLDGSDDGVVEHYKDKRCCTNVARTQKLKDSFCCANVPSSASDSANISAFCGCADSVKKWNIIPAGAAASTDCCKAAYDKAGGKGKTWSDENYHIACCNSYTAYCDTCSIRLIAETPRKPFSAECCNETKSSWASARWISTCCLGANPGSLVQNDFAGKCCLNGGGRARASGTNLWCCDYNSDASANDYCCGNKSGSWVGTKCCLATNGVDYKRNTNTAKCCNFSGNPTMACCEAKAAAGWDDGGNSSDSDSDDNGNSFHDKCCGLSSGPNHEAAKFCSCQKRLERGWSIDVKVDGTHCCDVLKNNLTNLSKARFQETCCKYFNDNPANFSPVNGVERFKLACCSPISNNDTGLIKGSPEKYNKQMCCNKFTSGKGCCGNQGLDYSGSVQAACCNTTDSGTATETCCNSAGAASGGANGTWASETFHQNCCNLAGSNNQYCSCSMLFNKAEFNASTSVGGVNCCDSLKGQSEQLEGYHSKCCDFSAAATEACCQAASSDWDAHPGYREKCCNLNDDFCNCEMKYSANSKDFPEVCCNELKGAHSGEADWQITCCHKFSVATLPDFKNKCCADGAGKIKGKNPKQGEVCCDGSTPSEYCCSQGKAGQCGCQTLLDNKRPLTKECCQSLGVKYKSQLPFAYDGSDDFSDSDSDGFDGDLAWYTLQCCGSEGLLQGDAAYDMYCSTPSSLTCNQKFEQNLDITGCCDGTDSGDKLTGNYWLTSCCTPKRVGSASPAETKAQCCTKLSHEANKWHSTSSSEIYDGLFTSTGTCCSGASAITGDDWLGSCCTVANAPEVTRGEECAYGDTACESKKNKCCQKLFDNLKDSQSGTPEKEKYNAIFGDQSACCTWNGALTGQAWLNGCCSKDNINSAGSMQASCCDHLYDTLDKTGNDFKTLFAVGSTCCNATGDKYSECGIQCDPAKYPDLLKNEASYHSDLADYCCKNGPDDNYFEGTNEQKKITWETYCCGLIQTDAKNDGSYDFKFPTTADNNQLCCDKRISQAQGGAYYYDTQYIVAPCPVGGVNGKCGAYKDVEKGLFCGVEACSIQEYFNAHKDVCCNSFFVDPNYKGSLTENQELACCEYGKQVTLNIADPNHYPRYIKENKENRCCKFHDFDNYWCDDSSSTGSTGGGSTGSGDPNAVIDGGVPGQTPDASEVSYRDDCDKIDSNLSCNCYKYVDGQQKDKVACRYCGQQPADSTSCIPPKDDDANSDSDDGPPACGCGPQFAKVCTDADCPGGRASTNGCYCINGDSDDDSDPVIEKWGWQQSNTDSDDTEEENRRGSQ